MHTEFSWHMLVQFVATQACKRYWQAGMGSVLEALQIWGTIPRLQKGWKGANAPVDGEQVEIAPRGFLSINLVHAQSLDGGEVLDTRSLCRRVDPFKNRGVLNPPL